MSLQKNRSDVVSGVTVFTPTFNRAHTLPRLYASLLQQSNKNFEWLIIDDGSSDNTHALIDSWIAEAMITISYLYQENSGKSQAINNGVLKASRELFFIVDSDDELTHNAIALIEKEWSSNIVKSLAGICFRKIDRASGTYIGGHLKTKADKIISNHSRINLNFDKAEVFVTKKLLMFPFPKFQGEKFVPESYIWCAITKKYHMLYVLNVGIYYCSYASDGYTKNFKQNFKANPRGFGLYYKYVLFNKNFKLINRVKALVRYIQTTINLKFRK